MEEHAVERLAVRVGEAAGTPVDLERPSDPSHGDYATNAALRLAGERRRPPRELAQELAETVSALPEIERAEVAGPGFVNLWLTRDWFGEALGEILEKGAEYGAGDPAPKERIQVEMVSANPTGPVTVASARNGAYGDSVARLLEFAGHEVEREFYVNDAGTQVERFMASIEAIRGGQEPPSDGYTGAYMTALAEEGDPIGSMLDSIRGTLERFRVSIDNWVRQSSMEERIPAAIGALDTYAADGALWVRTSAHGDEKDRVIIRSAAKGGRPAYVAWDAAYLRDKLERGFDRLIYILGADHHGYVGRLKGLAGAFGYDPDRVEVLLYQLVHLTRGGELAKMSKRRGDVVFLDELIDEIGVDAARWFLVDRGPDQTIEIDVDLAAERSRKNPVYYVQYVHARTVGVFREAGDAEVDASPYGELTREERDVVKRLADFPLVAAEATHRRAPHMVAYYAIGLADEFHRFYHDRRKHRILGTEAQGFRLGLCRATQTVIARSLDLLGVEAPERM